MLVPWKFEAQRAKADVGGTLVKFLEPVPQLGAGIVVATPKSVRPGLTRYAFAQTLISRQLHPQLPSTPVFAYDDGSGLAGQAGSFGMAVAATTGSPVAIDYTNRLPQTYPAWIPVDARLTPLGNQVRVMTHLHGGFVAADSGTSASLKDVSRPRRGCDRRVISVSRIRERTSRQDVGSYASVVRACWRCSGKCRRGCGSR